MSCQRHNNPFLHLSSALQEHFLEGIHAPLRLMTQMKRVTNTQILIRWRSDFNEVNDWTYNVNKQIVLYL